MNEEEIIIKLDKEVNRVYSNWKELYKYINSFKEEYLLKEKILEYMNSLEKGVIYEIQD